MEVSAANFLSLASPVQLQWQIPGLDGFRVLLTLISLPRIIFFCPKVSFPHPHSGHLSIFQPLAPLMESFLSTQWINVSSRWTSKESSQITLRHWEGFCTLNCFLVCFPLPQWKEREGWEREDRREEIKGEKRERASWGKGKGKGRMSNVTGIRYLSAYFFSPPPLLPSHLQRIKQIGTILFFLRDKMHNISMNVGSTELFFEKQWFIICQVGRLH